MNARTGKRVTPYPVVKRALDVGVSLAVAVPAAVVCALAAIAVRLVDGSPSIFTQVRVGRHQKPFVIYKIRTFTVDAPEVATHHLPSPESRLARFLRRTKLDELPQLVNVLRGEMSLVGPRPCLVSQTELIAARDRRNVFSVRPGITGRAQVMGVDMSEPERLAAIDADYLEEISFRSDLRYLVTTFTGALPNIAASESL